MNLPKIKLYEDQAIDIVVSVLNKAKEFLGLRQNLVQLAKSRNILGERIKLPLNNLGTPLAKTSEALIIDAIEKKWCLTPLLMYILKYQGITQDECSQYYYFEAIFSQPSKEYPIPQATVSVFFRVEDDHVESPDIRGIPKMCFRIEGHHSEHDARFVALSADWILSVLKMKINLFKRIESIKTF